MSEIKKVVLLIEVENEYGRGLLSGIAKYSQLYQPWTFYRLTPFHYEEFPFRRKFVGKKVFDHIYSWEPQGIISHVTWDIAEKLLDMGIPIINAMQTRRKKVVRLHTISSDYELTGRIAAEHFIGRGFRNYAYCGIADVLWAQERGKSFAKYARSAGFDVHFYPSPKSQQKQNWKYEQGLMAQWLGSLPKPLALLACNDQRAEQILEASKIAGIQIPTQLAVLGVDNDEFICELANPPLSSIAMDSGNAGFQAASLLNRLMKGHSIDAQTILVSPTHVVDRSSTDSLAVEDQDVERALRFIYQHCRKNIDVESVAANAMLSRRTLERRFKKSLGRSIQQEIRRVRVDIIAKMLLNTNLSISQIAICLNYPGIDHIARYFRQEKGISPKAYRDKYSNPISSVQRE